MRSYKMTIFYLRTSGKATVSLTIMSSWRIWNLFSHWVIARNLVDTGQVVSFLPTKETIKSATSRAVKAGIATSFKV